MSLHSGDWAKILGGLALAATGAGLAGLYGAGAGAAAGAGGAATGAGTAAGAAGTAAGAAAPAAGGFASLVAPALVGTGAQGILGGMAGTPTSKMTQPAGIPPMQDQGDPFAILRMIEAMKKGGLS